MLSDLRNNNFSKVDLKVEVQLLRKKVKTLKRKSKKEKRLKRNLLNLENK